MNIKTEEFNRIITEKGWIIFDSIIPLNLIEKMKSDLHSCYINCRKIQTKNNIANNTAFTAHHLVGQSQSFLDYLELNPIAQYIEEYFKGKYILNSFGGAINKANSKSYANEIHRDIRTYSGSENLVLNTLIMLDDFTKDNGPTMLLSGSHHMDEKPSKEYFDKYAEQAIAKKGSILLFNSNVWHSGGTNQTQSDRCSVTPMYSKPFIKPQFDYLHGFSPEEITNFSDNLKQQLGYYSRVPKTLNEWYQKPEKRMYRPDQG